MLLNRGELEGIRLLSPETIALITSDHLPLGVGDRAADISAFATAQSGWEAQLPALAWHGVLP